MRAAEIWRVQSLGAAKTNATYGVPPRAPHGVTRDSGGVFLAPHEQFPSHQPTHSALRRALRKPNRLGQLLITHLNSSPPSRLLGGEPYINEEARGPAIMPDQIAHQHIHDVIIQIQHDYTGH